MTDLLSSIFLLCIVGIYFFSIWIDNRDLKTEVKRLNKLLDLVQEVSKEEIKERRILEKLNKIKNKDLDRAYKIIEGAKRFIKKQFK
jgi:hypothetical protein